jgi:Ca2+-binding RTX toxin-like protein
MASSQEIIANGGAGNDTLITGRGNDILIGGDGADLLDGREGIDTVSYADQTGRVVVYLNDDGSSARTRHGAEGDQLFNIENLTGGSGRDALVGNSSANVLNGGAGNDQLYGLDGDDTLIGGGGGDTIDGGAANDLIHGDSAAGIGDIGLTIRFAGESADFKSTYGWYDGNTLQARVIVANADVESNPALAYFVTALPLTADEFDNLGFFLIPDGYALNEPEFDGGDPGALNLEVFDDGGIWKIRDAEKGYVFSGAGNAAYFTEPSKNRHDAPS